MCLSNLQRETFCRTTDFKIFYKNSKKYLKEITDAVKDSSKIILATDPDREGEAIAWHVKEYLNEKKLLKDKHVERVVFNEITKKAVTHAIDNPRQIEPLLVDAYMARRALDYLVGFNISPILWTKLPGSKSAGRVQSVALKLITEREHEIELFDPEEFWTLSVKFNDKNNNSLTANIFQLNDEKIEKFSFRNKNEIDKAIEEVKSKKFQISDISTKVVSRNPSGPFTTSTLQQVSSGRLNFGASRTMQIAQKLYQGIEIDGETIGLITYMRTDGTNISTDAVSSFRDYIKKEFGKVPKKLKLINCVGGGSSAMGFWNEFITYNKIQVELIGVEAGGPKNSKKHAAPLTCGAKIGVLHGAMQYVIQDAEGQIEETESISAGLDYPGVSPLHCLLKDSKRARYTSATDEEALAAFKLVSRLEKVRPSLEPAHAFAEAIKIAPRLSKDTIIAVDSCGDAKKDMKIIKERLGHNL